MKVHALVLVFSLFAGSAFARMDEERGSGGAPAPRLTPRQILDGIYKPWTGSLAELGKNLHQDRNYVVWIHVPAQHPMDLRSSEQFRRWAYATPVTELTISHNMVAFRCKNKDGRFVTGATGMTGASDLQEAKALLAGYGLSIFFATYTDGHLNPVSEVDGYVTKNLKKRGTIFGAFEVSQEQCGEMQEFLSEFVHHPNRPFERFNNTGDPGKFEGGGCVTLASVLMRKAGIMEPVIPHFFRDFYAARYLFGGNLKPIKDVEPPATPWLKGKRRSISFNLFWGNRWDYSPETFPGYMYLRQIDPEKMVYTLKQFAAVMLENESAADRSRDSRRIAASPLGKRISLTANNLAGNGSEIEYIQTPIDDHFDDEMAAMGSKARAWFRERVRDGYKIRMGSAVGMPVLLLEKE